MEQEHNSFFQPQRQSKTGIALLFLYNTGQVIKNLWVFIIFLFVGKDKFSNIFIILLSISAILLILIVSAVLKYYNFKYYIDAENDEFVIEEGIINKSVTKIKKENIQEVNISQPFIHRFFNIYKLEVDTPGSVEKEVKISALTKQNASDLKKYLLAETEVGKYAAQSSENIDNKEIRELRSIKISTLSILKYGITSNYIQSFFALVSLLIYGFAEIEKFLRKAEFETQLDYDTVEAQFLKFSIPVMTGIVFIVVILAILINAVRTIIKYFNFKITENDQNFSFEYGLFSTKNSIVTKKKVQVVTETQNWIQKKMNVSFVKFLQIGKDENEKNVSAVPGIHKKEKEKLFHSIWKTNPDFTESMKPNFRLLIVNNFIWIALPLIIIYFINKNLLLEYWQIALACIVFLELIIVISYLNLRLYYSEKFIRLKSGFWDIDNRTFEIEKLQTVKISQYFWQRKTNLGSITFYTSAGKFSIAALNFLKVKKLLNYIIYKIEISKNK